MPHGLLAAFSGIPTADILRIASAHQRSVQRTYELVDCHRCEIVGWRRYRDRFRRSPGEQKAKREWYHLRALLLIL
jgi:hypothetical protein